MFVLACRLKARVVALVACLPAFVVGSARAEPGDSRIPTASAASRDAPPASPAPAATTPDAVAPSEPAAPVSETATAPPGPDASMPPASAAPTPVAEPPPKEIVTPPRAPATSPAPRSLAGAKLRLIERRWYGWQTLASDAASLGIVLSLRDPTATKIGVLSYLTVPPLIHVANGNYAPGLGSLGLRLLAPPVGAVLGLAVGAAVCRGDHDCLEVPVAAGFGVGVAAATALDASVLAVKQPAHPVGVGFHWRPVILAGKKDARIGVAGTF